MSPVTPLIFLIAISFFNLKIWLVGALSTYLCSLIRTYVRVSVTYLEKRAEGPRKGENLNENNNSAHFFSHVSDS